MAGAVQGAVVRAIAEWVALVRAHRAEGNDVAVRSRPTLDPRAELEQYARAAGIRVADLLRLAALAWLLTAATRLAASRRLHDDEH